MTLSVFFQFSPHERMPVGTLSDFGRDTVFEYDPSFLSRGINPAPFRLPLHSGVQVYDRSGNMETFGLFEDSLPDGWGRRLVDVAFRKEYGRIPSVLERLACVGANGRGALVYEPEEELADEVAACDLATLAKSAMAFDAGRAEDVLPAVRKACAAVRAATIEDFGVKAEGTTVIYSTALGKFRDGQFDAPLGYAGYFEVPAKGEAVLKVQTGSLDYADFTLVCDDDKKLDRLVPILETYARQSIPGDLK